MSSIYFSRILIFFSYALIISSAFANFSISSSIVLSLLILGLFLIFLALAPNQSVLIVSSSLKEEGEHVMIRHVFEFPPSDSYKTLVSLESQ